MIHTRNWTNGGADKKFRFLIIILFQRQTLTCKVYNYVYNFDHRKRVFKQKVSA